MTSRCAIINDTPYPVFCKIGQNQALLAFFNGFTFGLSPGWDWGNLKIDQLKQQSDKSWVATVLGAHAFDTLPKANYTTILDKAAINGGVSPFDVNAATTAAASLVAKGYNLVPPNGGDTRSGKLTLSLVRSGICFKILVRNEKMVNIERYKFQTMWSGATIGSTKKYKMSNAGYWDKYEIGGTPVGQRIALKLKIVNEEAVDESEAETDEDEDQDDEEEEDESLELTSMRGLRSDDARLFVQEDGTTRELKTSDGAPLTADHPVLRQ